MAAGGQRRCVRAQHARATRARRNGHGDARVNEPKQISRQAPTPRSMDFAALRTHGLALCEALASDRWTDYNEHDPGVTILEQLCYALTDLAYRTNFPVEDILASRPIAAGDEPDDTLFTGDQVLTCSPLTANDYQRLLYDEIPGLRNAWLQPVTDHPLGIRGLYKVMVEPFGSSSEAAQEGVRAEVLERMRANRNLAEDIDSVEVLRPFPLRVEATLVIAPGPNPAHVLANALFAVQEQLVPYPRAVPLVESLAANIPPDEIFVGPLLELGGVEYASNGSLPTEIAVQRVRRLLAGVPGVRDVKSLSVNGAHEGTVRLAPGCVPRLEPSIYQAQRSYPIQIETPSGERQSIDTHTVWRLIQRQLDELKNREAYALKTTRESGYTQRPRGQDRDIARYYSIQHQFPATFGLGKLGIVERSAMPELLPDALRAAQEDAPARRTRRWSQSRQLKAYLLFFEQLLADHLAQLAHAGDLFALDSSVDRSYFAQPLVHEPAQDNDPPGGADVLMAAPTPKSEPEPFRVCILDDRPGPSGSDPAEILLMSREVNSIDEAWRTLDDILRRGQAAPSYATETSHHGDVRLVLLDAANRPLAHGEERFTTHERAHEGRAHLRHFLSRLAVDRELRDRYIKHVSRLRPIGLRVVDEIGRVLLSSYDLSTVDARRRREDQILHHGIHPQRYQVREHSNGELSVLLCDEHHRIIAFGGRRFAAREEADREIRTLCRRLQALRHGEALRDRYLQRLPESPAPASDNGRSADEKARQRTVQEYQRALERIVADPRSAFLHRRNRFLDHLLARFGERFDDDALSFFDPRPYGERDGFYRELTEWKLDFLRHYVQLSAQRGRGFDYTGAGSAAQDNLSGLERRLYRLLGLQGQVEAPKQIRARRPLTTNEHAFAYIEAEGEINLSALLDAHGEHRFLFSSTDPAIFQALLRHARREHFSVERRSDSGRWHVHFHGPNGIAYEVHRAAEEADAWAAVERFVHYLRDYGAHGKNLHDGEGLYVLEHVLLRSAATDRWATELLPLAAAAQNYRTEAAEPDEIGRSVRLLLCRDDAARTPVAHYRHLFYTFDEAEQWRRHLAPQIAMAAAQPAYFTRYVHLFVPVAGAAQTTPDTFYSYRISVFLSAWPIRGQHRGFREFAEQTVYANCPAHIAARCFWLGFRDMRAFETLHAAWLQAKAAAEKAGAGNERARRTLDRLADGLKEFVEWVEAVEDKRARRGPSGMPPALAALVRELEESRRPAARS